MALLLCLGLLPAVFGYERDVAYYTDAWLGMFRLRELSATKAALAGSATRRANASLMVPRVSDIVDSAEPSDYEYAYDTRTAEGPRGAIQPRCITLDFDRETAR